MSALADKCCRMCGERKPPDEFYRAKDRRDGLQGACKSCMREYKRKRAERHPERIRASHHRWREDNAEHERTYTRARRLERRNALDAIKRTQGCADCGTTEGDLHFDHRPGTVKLFNVAHGVGHSWAKLLAEIAKCDVRCSPCHGKRHAAERGAE